ncbi:MAG: DUF3108 domain-containing protein [Pseudomonadota bacterium]
MSNKGYGMGKMIRNGLAVFLLTICMLPATAVNAEEYKHRSSFTVKFAGIEIGKATFNIDFDDVSYSLKGSGKTSGLIEWVAPSAGQFASAGTMIENQLKPEIHTVSVTEKKKKPESVKLSFAEEKIVDVQIRSNKKRKVRKAPKYVPVEARHLAAVMDPASTLLVPLDGESARDGRKVCNQRFPVFDGETRYDIQLGYKSTKPVTTKGYTGHAYVCQLRYIPVAGHKKNQRNVKEMAENKNMEIWLAPMESVSVFTPIKISIGTKYGRFVADPTYFGSAS